MGLLGGCCEGQNAYNAHHSEALNKCKLMIVSRGAELKEALEITAAWPREEQGFSL